MTRRAAHNVLKDAFEAAGLNGHLATHSLRKSFAQRLYEQTGDVFTVQEMLGHKSIATNTEILGRELCERPGSVAENVFGWRLHETSFLGSSLKNEADETLFLELALRGYDLSKLRDDTEPGHTANRSRDCQNRHLTDDDTPKIVALLDGQGTVLKAQLGEIHRLRTKNCLI